MQKTENTRIDELLKYLGISQLEFARKVGTTTNAVTNWKKRELGRTVINKIVNAYPQINVTWLINGEGPVFKWKEYLEETYTPAKEDDVKKYNNEERPHYIALAKAGLPTTEQDGSYEMQPIISQLPRYDYTVEVRGDSMAPEYKSGDTIACLDVTKSSYIQWGRVHLINTAQGVMLKKIYDNEESIRCVSINSDEYPEFCIPKSEIYTVGLVVGSLRIS